MESIHLFNPENDLALANFASNYTPPASAVRMARELAVLPIWYAAGEHPLVIAEGEVDRDFVRKIKTVLPIKAGLISYGDLPSYSRHEIIPWGWNPSLVRKLKGHGVEVEQLIGDDALKTLREYSHRRHAVEMLQGLLRAEGSFIGGARYFERIDELLAYLSSFPGDKALKMPLSGSGRGLIWILGDITDKQTDWARRVIREQGGVVAEPMYTRVKDFAMEFFLDQGCARFTGYSLFQTASSGAYMGNELKSDQRILEELAPYTPITALQQLKEWHARDLASRFPLYRGYAGVDMMVCDTADGYRLHPCVEVNMRMNMGIASRLIHEQYVNENSEGEFSVRYFKKPEGAFSFHRTMLREHPLAVVNEKVASGYLPLTPVTAKTRYLAYAIIRA